MAKTTKPSFILSLEKTYNIILKPVQKGEDIMNWNNRNTYLLNDKNEIIGLNLRANKINDISHIKELKQLTQLDLGDNQIKDISHLKELKLLTELHLSNNQINDISHIKELKLLTQLYLNSNQIKDISHIKELKLLTQLYLSSNQINNISHIKELKLLTQLDLSSNQINDISHIKELKQLTQLDLSNNQINDISHIKELKQLTKLILYNNQINDFSHIKELKLLTQLDLYNNQINDISHIKELKQLTQLDLSYNQINYISHLKELKLLTQLDLRSNKINDISQIKELKLLTQLYLSYNQINDISQIKELKLLTQLDLSNNQINDISQFKFIENLPELHISAYHNPCFEKDTTLEEYDNNYNAIITALKNVDEAQTNDGGVEASLPEKIVLLGNHASGKSSLLNYLKTKVLDYESSSTHILKIEPYLIEPKNTKPKALPDAIVYDFGGQDFYHGIYQAFLTSYALTLLVWNKGTNKNEIKPDANEKFNRNFNVNYWLGQLQHKGFVGELILVQTHKDEEEQCTPLTYSNEYKQIMSEFFVSLKNKNINSLNLSALRYLKDTIDDTIGTKQKAKNPANKMAKSQYLLLMYVLNTDKKHESISIDELKAAYIIKDDEARFNGELEQLILKGLVLVHEQKVWLNPTEFTSYVHTNILNKEQVGDGVIDEETFNKKNIDKDIVALLLHQKVIFLHEHGLSKTGKPQREYIIPNYLQLITQSGIDYHLMAFGLDDPLFILKFTHFIPFGIINQMVCYFGKLPDNKKFWRDTLIFTISEQGKEKAKKNVKVLISLDFEHLEIKVYAVFGKDVGTTYKNNVEQYLYYAIIRLYHNQPLFENIEEYVKFKNTSAKELEKLDKASLNEEELKALLPLIVLNEIKQKGMRISADYFISKDDKLFISANDLAQFKTNDNNTKIKTYTINEHRVLAEYRETPVTIYQNFTNEKLQSMKKIFISYSNRDIHFKQELEKHLKPLNSLELAKSWSGEEITEGLWHNQIQAELASADIIVLMLSIDFMTSDYILKEELFKAFLEIKNNPHKKIVCVLVRDFAWHQFKSSLSLDELYVNLIDETSDADKIKTSYQVLPHFQILPFYYEGKKEDKDRCLKAIEEWEFPNKAYKAIADEIFKLVKSDG